ncbi:hypothetical protein [Thermobrachium celere]|uniref:Membrane spanning protein n=1 Tax=Thermobrachium celere DSM 8682 TaxID=941824 RepID=R7RRS9_9CLOT|nr:hypothetical protein [Thermobrachium celere]CDF58769.1 membrane spanning protein [Thermobrachium celere DSM 8682]
MKKIFNIIGVLLGIYIIYTFLLFVNAAQYRLNDTIYDVSLDNKSITCNRLEEYAQKSDVTIVLINFKNTSFFNCDLEFSFINPGKDIKMGRQPSILPRNKIVYKDAKDIKEQKVRYFHIVGNEEEKVEKIIKLFEQNGYKIGGVVKRDKIKVDWKFFFSNFNIKFQATLILLLILSIIMYYVHRLKEIGILKLNGWNDTKIISRVFIRMLIQTMLFSFMLILPFGIYVILTDKTKIHLYFEIVFILILVVVFVFILSIIFGVFFVRDINQVLIIKNKKNNKMIFYVLICFKFIIGLILLITMNESITTMNSVRYTTSSINKLSRYDFYRINTSCTPEKELNEKINKLIDSIDSSHFYVLRVSDYVNYNELNKFISSRKLRSYDNKTICSISPNMLKYLTILDEKGKEITEDKINKNTILVPMHYKKYESILLNEYKRNLSEKNMINTNIIYIKDGQVYDSIFFPNMYIYDCIFEITNIEKEEYYIYGFNLLDEYAAKQLQKGFKRLGINEGSIYVVPLKVDYEKIKQDLELELYRNISYIINSFLAFLVCIISLVIIFLELRKKELGVYKLIGKCPIKVIWKFILISCSITIVIAMIINPVLLLIIFLEISIYLIYINKYLKNKAILSLKGE